MIIVQRDVIIERRVHSSCSESVRDRSETDHPELTGYGEAEKSCSSQKDTDSRHFSCSELMSKPVTHQAGDYGAERYDH